LPWEVLELELVEDESARDPTQSGMGKTRSWLGVGPGRGCVCLSRGIRNKYAWAGDVSANASTGIVRGLDSFIPSTEGITDPMAETRPTVELETQERRVYRQQNKTQTPTHLEEVLQFHTLRSGSGPGGTDELLGGGVGVVVRRGQGDGHDLARGSQQIYQTPLNTWVWEETKRVQASIEH
jgi:hypothetical protein